MENIEKYNTEVRQAISSEYRRCNKQKAEYEREFEVLTMKLANEGGTLTHNQYLKISNDSEYLRRRIEELSIELDTWDKAREICLNIAYKIL